MRRPRQSKNTVGFTLVEVMITLFLISLMSLGVFVGLQQITRAMMAVAARDEAYHLLQAEAERLLTADYGAFTASGNQTITSALKTSYTPSSDAKFVLPADNASGRMAFTRRVVELASTPSTRTLRVDVSWSLNGRNSTVSTRLFRLQ